MITLKQSNKKFWFQNINYYLVIAIIFLLLLFIYYYGIFYYKYSVPFGDDGLRHMTEAKFIVGNGFYKVHLGSGDPPLFHILLAVLGIITGSSVIDATKFFAPFLVILAIFASYFIANRFFNQKIALLTFIIFAFIPPALMRTYDDGTYLNIVAANFFLVFAIAFLASFLKSTKCINWKYTIGVVLFSGAVLLSHSMSSSYLIMIFVTVFIYSLILLFFRKNRRLAKNLIILYLFIFLIFLPLTWAYYLRMVLEKIGAMLGLIELSGSNVLGDFSYFSLPLPFQGYVWHHTLFLIFASFVGLFCCIIFIKNKHIEKFLLIIWLGVLLFGSRFSFFQLPTRFARDMAMPLAIFSAILFYICYKFIINKDYKSLASLITVIILSMFLVFGAGDKIIQAAKYNPMERLQNVDKQALDWIENNTAHKSIFLVTPPTIVVGSWGSYIELITDRKVIYDYRLFDAQMNNYVLSNPIYNPMSELSVKFYKENKIEYVYAGKKVMGSMIGKDNVNWQYQKHLSKAIFLNEATKFYENKELGSVIIYEVNQDILNQLYNKN